jgi:hypothetical protein
MAHLHVIVGRTPSAGDVRPCLLIDRSRQGAVVVFSWVVLECSSWPGEYSLALVDLRSFLTCPGASAFAGRASVASWPEEYWLAPGAVVVVLRLVVLLVVPLLSESV